MPGQNASLPVAGAVPLLMTEKSQGYPSFEPEKLTITDVFEFSADPALLDLSEETLKALVMPSRRPAAILQHLVRQGDALAEMHEKIRSQLRRLQIDERFLKKRLGSMPVEPENLDAPGPAPVSMDVDAPSTSPKTTATSVPSISPPKPSILAPQDEEEEEEDDDAVDLPPSLRSLRPDSYMDDDDDDDEADAAMSQVHMILASQRGK